MRSTLLLAGLLLAAPALAEEPRDEPEQRPLDAAQATREGTFLPTTVAARIGDQRVTGWFLGGFDSTPLSTKAPGGAPVVALRIEGALFHRVALHVAMDFESYSGQARPSAGLRVGLLRQEKHGLDLGLMVQYRQKGFTQSSGEIETFVTASRRWSRLALYGNLVYGQGLDPKERDGEVRLAALVALHERWNIGLDASAKVDLGEETPGREAAELEGKFDLRAGPMATFSAGPFAFMVQAGVHTFLQQNDRGTHIKNGAIALAGMGATF